MVKKLIERLHPQLQKGEIEVEEFQRPFNRKGTGITIKFTDSAGQQKTLIITYRPQDDRPYKVQFGKQSRGAFFTPTQAAIESNMYVNQNYYYEIDPN